MISYIQVNFIFFNNIKKPWHPQGFFLSKAAVTGSILEGNQGFFKMTDVLYQNFDNHVDSKVEEKSPKEWTTLMLEAAVSVGFNKEEFEKCYDSDEAVLQTKILQKYGRQNAIHVTPTILVNGLIENSASSSWTEEDWKNYLSKI
jgi:protein-disulfide isomerase